ncbi:hypothetical protein [Flagellimonas nanhaiensis]|uniref:Uncharacterized protein n=1 Tax=Flagellimonas nanhaiensis TaxID=2292706 RepID=A0A371JTA3_9FLAO|nr:hypothetical protein [Allomuricauda nanhaiensis]RDY61050.1 hypothetical protein DX873_02435 [Allomuricauda nanhaiensis]
MSEYTFEKLPDLREALVKGDVTSALDLVPLVDVEEDAYEYVALVMEIDRMLMSFYSSGNQLAVSSTIELISKTDRLHFSEDWPQFTDLISKIVGMLAEMDKGAQRDELLKVVLSKLPLKDRRVSYDENLNFNLACYYAINDDVKTMTEYVRRASFYYEKEQFLEDKSFEKYKTEPFFVDVLENIGYTASSWWKCAWPIEEWYEKITY